MKADQLNKETDRKSFEANYNNLFNIIPQPLFVCRRNNYKIVGANNAAKILYGYSDEEFADLSFHNLKNHPAQGAKDVTSYANNFQLKEKIEQNHFSKSGKRILVEVTVDEIFFGEEWLLLFTVNDITDRRIKENKIIVNAAIVESSEDAIIGKTLDGIITNWNDGAEKMYQYSEEEIIGRSVEIIFPTDRKNEFSEIMKKLNRGEKIEHYRTKRIRKDGSLLDVSVSISPIKNKTGIIIGASTIARDITQRINLEKALRENDEMMKLALASGKMGIWEWNISDNTIKWDDFIYPLFGLKKNEFSGKYEDFLKLVFPADRERVNNDIEHAVSKGNVFESEYRVVWPDESLHSIFARGKVFTGEKNLPEKILGVCIDISEKKKNELEKDELLKSEKQLRVKAENLQERLFFLAEASRILSSSLEYKITLNEVTEIAVPFISDYCALYLADESGKLKQVALAKKYNDKVNYNSVFENQISLPENILSEVLHDRKIKTIFDLSEASTGNADLQTFISSGLKSVMIVPLNTNEKVLGLLVLAMSASGRQYKNTDVYLAEDLANRIAMAVENAGLYNATKLLNAELEERVKQRTSELEFLNKELEAFSYSVSHDLRAPLRAIQGFAKILEEDFTAELDNEAKRIINIISSNTNRMGRLIDELLAFSRMTRTKLSYSKVNFNLMINNIFEELNIADRKIDLKIEELPISYGDEVMLHEVWTNLISNALKFSSKKETSKIEIGSKLEDNETVYFIKDNGAGFDMQYAGKLFGVFERLHKNIDFEGTGVGLALVHKIITRHDGRIWAESKINMGATFYFTLGTNNEKHQ